MAPVVRISEELFKELQRRAEPLVDTVEDVIWRLLRQTNGGGPPSRVPPSPPETPPGPPWYGRGRPISQRFAKEILLVLRDGGPMWSEQVIEQIGKRFGEKLSDYDWTTDPSGQIRWHHRIHTTKFTLKRLGFLENPGKGVRSPWKITPEGLEWLKSLNGKASED